MNSPAYQEHCDHEFNSYYDHISERYAGEILDLKYEYEASIEEEEYLLGGNYPSHKFVAMVDEVTYYQASDHFVCLDNQGPQLPETACPF